MSLTFNESQKEISLSDLFTKIEKFIKYLMTKWKIVIFVVLLGSVIGFAISHINKKMYIANLSFAIEEEKSGSGFSGALGIASQLGIDLGGSSGTIFSGANLIELIKSRYIIEKALLSPVSLNGKTRTFAEMFIDQMRLRIFYKNDSNLINIHFPLDYDRNTFNRDQNSVLAAISGIISKRLKVDQRDKKTNIIDVKFVSEDEILAKMFTETLVNTVTLFYTDTKTKKSTSNIAILTKQLDSIKAAMNSAMSNVANANDNAFNLNPALGIKKVPAQKKMVDVQVNSAIYTQLIQNLELSKISLRKETPLIQIIDAPIYPLSSEEPNKLIYSLIGFVISFIVILCWYIFFYLFQRNSNF